MSKKETEEIDIIDKIMESDLKGRKPFLGKRKKSESQGNAVDAAGHPLCCARNPLDYPIHASEFNRRPILTDTTCKPSRTHLTFIPSVEEMIARGYASETFTHTGAAQYGDFTGTFDYEDILNAAAETREMYEDLPEDIRGMFKSPDELLRFVQDPANHERAVALGILKFNPQKAETESSKVEESKADQSPS